MAVLKTWNVVSSKSRHPEMDGETVPFDEPFSNGMMYPGDPMGGPDQTGGCQCVLSIEGDPPTTFDDQEAARKWGDDKFDEWVEGLSEDEITDIARYAGNEYRDINHALRRGDDIWDVGRAENIEAALDKAVIPEDLVAWRYGKLPEDLQIGAIFSDDGFTSTSLLKRFVDDFSGTGRGMKIIIPQGTKGAYIHAATNTNMALHEAEVLLQHGSRFKFMGIDGDGYYILKIV